MSVAILIPWALLALVLAFGWWLQRRYERGLRVHQQAERTLKVTEGTLRRMSQAIESASDAIGIGDMEGTSLYHNRAHIGLFGYSVDELNAVPGGGVLFADPLVAHALHAAIRAGHSWAGETPVRTRDGRVVPCFVRADIIRDEMNQAVGIFGVFTDITERQRAKREIEEERQRLHVTLQSIGEAVITTDAAGRVILLNATAERFTGWTQERATGKPLSEVVCLLDETTHERRESAVTHLLADRKQARTTETALLVGPGGEERLIAESAALIVTADHRRAGAVLAMRDIARERSKAEDTTRATKLESLGMMAGSIAHDFGNLLVAIAGNLDLVRIDDSLSEFVRARIEDADRAVWRARDVTQQLTSFAKGGATRKKVVAVSNLLHEGVGFAVQNTPVTAIFDLPPDLWPVEADESQLVQVFNNLAVNAVQAMGAGGTLRVVAENFAADADTQSPLQGERHIMITVTDTGSGIAPENLSKIFDPFFTTKKTGSGFGLATCYSVVKRHGGHIRAESTVGRGTTFQIVLPAAETAAPPAQESEEPKAAGRILVMDDDEAGRQSIGAMLEFMEFEMVEAADGAEAMEKYAAAQARGRPFDAALFDLRVKEGLGGVEVVRRLRTLDPAFRAIAISAYPEEAAMSDCRAHGFGAALVKPFKMAQLEAALRSVLAGRTAE